MPYRKRPNNEKGLYPLHNGEGFTVRWIASGRLQFKRLVGYSKTEARKWRNQQIADADRGRALVMGRLTFADLVRLKRTHAAAKQNRGSAEPSRALAEHFGYAEHLDPETDALVVDRAGWRVADITTECVDEFLAARRAGGVKLDTAQADLRWLRHACNLAVEAKRLTRDQVPTIKTHDPQNVRTNFPEPEQLAAIIAALPEYLRGVVAFAVTTAWRIKSMVLPLLWQHVDWKRTGATAPVSSGPASGVAASLSSSRSRSSASGASGFATSRASEKPVVSLAVGDRVTHDQFGLGTVVAVKGTGGNAEATIDFGEAKPKRLLLRYAPVEKL